MREVGVLGIAGARSTEQLAAAFRARGVGAEVLGVEALAHDLGRGVVRVGGRDVRWLSALVVKKLGDAASPLAPVRALLLRAVAAAGVPVFSPADAIVAAVDRYEMTRRLVAAGLPVPETVVTESAVEAERFVEEVGAAVYKPRFTSKARGMRILRRGEGLGAALAAIAAEGGLPYYLQRFLPDVERDIGVAVCDGRAIGAYYRVRAGHAWSTTTSEGGRYAPCPLDEELRSLAVRANEPFGLTFTTVDVVRHGGTSYLYEVSAFGGFHGLEACQVDGAAAFSDAVLARIGDAP